MKACPTCGTLAQGAICSVDGTSLVPAPPVVVPFVESAEALENEEATPVAEAEYVPPAEKTKKARTAR